MDAGEGLFGHEAEAKNNTVSHIHISPHGIFDFVKLTCTNTYDNRIVRRIRRMLVSSSTTMPYASSASSSNTNNDATTLVALAIAPISSSITVNNPRISALLDTIRNVEMDNTRAVVETFECLFYMSKKEIADAPKTCTKLVVHSRNMCMVCGRIFTSRGKLFLHLNANATHDTTPDVIATVALLCLVGLVADAARLLWNCPDKAQPALFSVMHVFIEKIHVLMLKSSSTHTPITERLWTLVDALSHVARNAKWKDEADLLTIAESRNIPASFGSSDKQQECQICHDSFAYLANHETIPITCSHRVCQIPQPPQLPQSQQQQQQQQQQSQQQQSQQQQQSFQCPHCLAPATATPSTSSHSSQQQHKTKSTRAVDDDSDDDDDDEMGAHWQIETSSGVWRDVSRRTQNADPSLRKSVQSLNDELEEVYGTYMNVGNLPIESRAVSMEAIVRFTQDHSVVVVDGVKKSIFQITTEELVHHIVVPECRQLGVRRYHEVISRTYGREHVGRVTVFVSHAWSNNWALVLAMLTNTFSWKRCQDLSVYFWIDAFAVCQKRHVVSDKGTVVNLENSEVIQQANSSDLINFERPLFFAARTFGVMNSDGVGAADKDLCQRAWCLFEFATTLSHGNVLSFRLGSYRKLRLSKHYTAASNNDPATQSDDSSLSFDISTSASNSNSANAAGTTAKTNAPPLASVPSSSGMGSTCVVNRFPKQFRFLETIEMVWAKPSKLKKHASNLDVKQAKCRVPSDMDNVIRPRVTMLGNGDLKRGYDLVNDTVKQSLNALQELLEWRDNELSYAAFFGQMDVLKKLLASGDDPNQPDKSDKTPLHRACKNGSSEAIALLLGAGALVDARDRDRNTPLHIAAQAGHELCISALLAKGADPEARNRFHFTPIDLATSNQHNACVQRLVDGKRGKKVPVE